MLLYESHSSMECATSTSLRKPINPESPDACESHNGSCTNADEGGRTVFIIKHCGPTMSSVTRRCLSNTPTGEPANLPDAEDHQYFDLSKAEHGTQDSGLPSNLRRARNALQKLIPLLMGTNGRTTSTKDGHGRTMLSRSRMAPVLGEGAFSSRKHMSDFRDFFAQIRCEYANGVTSSQYFKPCCTELQPSDLKANIADRFGVIIINTGMCLFSSTVMSDSSNIKKHSIEDSFVPEIPYDDSLRFYEVEIMARLSSAVADIVGLVENSLSSRSLPIRINFDIPDFQYYWTACELFERGLVDANYMMKWFSAIDARRYRLISMMQLSLDSMLQERGLPQIDIVLASDTAAVASLFRREAAIGNVPGLEEILCVLISDGRDAKHWVEFLDYLDAESFPQSVTDLSQLAYVFSAVKATLSGPQTTLETKGSALIIQVDSVLERRIFERAKAYLKRYVAQRSKSKDRHVLIALYPMERIFMAGPGISSFYLDDPGNSLMADDGSSFLDPVDVVSAAYGTHLQDVLRSDSTEMLECIVGDFKIAHSDR